MDVDTLDEIELETEVDTLDVIQIKRKQSCNMTSTNMDIIEFPMQPKQNFQGKSNFSNADGISTYYG